MKIVKLSKLHKLVSAIQEIDELLPVYKEETDRFIRLSDLLLDDYVSTEILLVPQSDWDWYWEKLTSFNEQDAFWTYLADGAIDRSLMQKISTELLSLTPRKEDTIYV